MAKKKLTSRQRKAHKKASYIRSEYFKTVDALAFLERFTKVKKYKLVSKPTRRSLKAIRKIYKETRASVQRYDDAFADTITGDRYEKLPTKKEMIKQVRAEKTQAYRQYRAEPETPPPDFDPAQDRIDEIIQKIRDIDYLERTVGFNKKSEATFNKGDKPKFDKAKQDWETAIENAIKKYGTERTAQALAEDPNIQKIDDLSMKYAYETSMEINDSILPWFEASIQSALKSL